MTHEPANAEQLFHELLNVVPEYAPHYTDHMEANDELLPYVLMDDFSRFVVECCGSEDPDLFERCISLINAWFVSGGDDVRLLLRSTFAETVETLWRNKDEFSRVYDALVPELQHSIRRFD